MFFLHTEDKYSMTTVSNKAISPIVITTWSMYITGQRCGGILTSPTGTIKSVDRDFDGMYDPDLHCIWIIVAPTGKLINFEFIEFQLYGECGDFILVRNYLLFSKHWQKYWDRQ